MPCCQKTYSDDTQVPFVTLVTPAGEREGGGGKGGGEEGGEGGEGEGGEISPV